MAATKVASKYAPAPKVMMTLLEPSGIWSAIDNMTPDQFAHYESALRATDYYALNPSDQQNYTVAMQAVNARRQAEGSGFNVTIRDGNQASAPFGSNLPALPFGLQWTPLLAIGGVLALVFLMGRR